MSIAKCKKEVTPLLKHWSYVFLALSHQCEIVRERILSVDGTVDDCGINTVGYIVETLYNTINFCWSTHKRHSIARPKGRGMGCILWVQRATYYKLIDIELYEIFAIINRAIKGLHCISLAPIYQDTESSNPSFSGHCHRERKRSYIETCHCTAKPLKSTALGFIWSTPNQSQSKIWTNLSPA